MILRYRKQFVRYGATAIGLVLLVAFVGPFIQYRKSEYWVCPVSGSTKQQVTWFGMFASEVRTTSALEKWIVRREPSFEPSWQRVSTSTHYLLAGSYGCSTRPVIGQLRPILDDAVARFSDERIGDLVRVLRQGSPEEQQEAVDRISEDYFANE